MDHETKIESISINKIEPIVSINFKHDDIDSISKSIKEIRYEPVIVRPNGDGTYQLCSHPEIFEALKLLEEKAIDCIIQDISEQQGRERILALLLRNPEISSKEQESLVWTLYNEGGYKSHAELGRKLGVTGEHVSRLCYAKEQREKLFGNDVTSDHVSTETLRLIKSFSDDEQKQFCDRIGDKKIHLSHVRDALKFLKDTTPSNKDAILNGEFLWGDAKDAIERGYPAVKKRLNKIQNDYEEPKKLQKIIEKEIPYFSSELYSDLEHFFKDLNPIYYDNIEDELEKKQADADENLAFALFTDYMFKRGKINESLYKTILQTLNLDSEIVEHLKEDGSLPQFQEEP